MTSDIFSVLHGYSFNQNQQCIDHQCPQQTVDKKRDNDKVSGKKLSWIKCHCNDRKIKRVRDPHEQTTHRGHLRGMNIGSDNGQRDT